MTEIQRTVALRKLAPAPSGPQAGQQTGQGDAQIAHVVSVTGSQAIAVLEQMLIGGGADATRTQIGSVVKIKTPRADVIGLISGMSVPVPSMTSQYDELRVVELDLVGEIPAESPPRLFRRGISGLPALGDPVFFANRDDLECVYNPQGRAAAKIGTLFQDEGIPAEVMVDELLAKHFCIVGSTGSGKSCALAGIMLSVLEQSPEAHIIVLDLHNEYSTAFEGRGLLITPASLELPFWMLNAEELAAVIVGDAPHDDENEILGEAVQHAKRRYSEASRARSQIAVRKVTEPVAMGIDAPTPFRLIDVTSYLDEQMGKLERARSTLPYRHLKQRIETLTSDPRYSFMFGSVAVQDSMVEILGRIFRIPVEGKPVTVLDLSAVPSEILNMVISTLCRITFDLGVWSRGQIPITLICEEAHRYAPLATKSTFAPARRALARIAKEGRKYAISLGLVTQRPSELDPTVLSQCNTVFALRLSNELDQQVIRAATADSALSLLNFLPSLGDGEAIAVGQGVTLPMRIRFTELPRTRIPASRGAGFSKAWSSATVDAAQLEQVVARWRMNSRSD
jgi:DNA helicase HerA-like ATPase